MSKCNSKKNDCGKENSDSSTKVNLAETASLGREKATDESQQDFNFVGTLNNWTGEDEQEKKVKEIEKVTKEQVGHVKEAENNNHGKWNRG